jgi:MYND finger
MQPSAGHTHWSYNTTTVTHHLDQSFLFQTEFIVMLNFIDDARVHFRVCRMCGVEEQGGEEAATVSSSDCCTDKSDAPSPRSPQRLKLCRACQAVAYCSRECQMSHWKEHRPHCKLIKSMLDIHQSTVPFDVPKFIEEAFRHGTSVPLRRGKHGESFDPEARE